LIIDANAHVTRDGRWFDTGHDASLGRLLAELDAAGVDRAVLTGLSGATSTKDVLALCAEADGRLLPVGPFDPSAHPSPAQACAHARRELSGRGLLGVKLHPRLGGYDVLDDRVLAFLDDLATWPEQPAVWICTFLHVPGMRPRSGPVEALCEIVGRHPDVQFVLAHGGGPDLLRLAAAVRAAPNALLDVSFTINRYHGSSVQLDLAHLLTTFENRLVFGSDFPEVEPRRARALLEELVTEAEPDALSKVLGGNLCRALALDAA
jgi:predicted TIM-barrel fold metal-dependent hydrolase